MRLRTLRLLVAVVIAAPFLVTAPTNVAAASTIEIRGTVVCKPGENVVGVWVQSSGGGSNFASWTAYPGRPHVARYSLSFTTNLTSSIFVTVGCGGTRASWGRSAKSPTVKATLTAKQVFLNTRCQPTCVSPPMENNTPAAPATNWFVSSQCTARAADFWKRMTSRYPNWRNAAGKTGNAGEWDNLAAETGWQVESVPMADSLAIRQPANGDVGHVMYVADVKITGAETYMLVFDRNSGYTGKDRNGVWVKATSSMRFIVVPPRADSIARNPAAP